VKRRETDHSLSVGLDGLDDHHPTASSVSKVEQLPDDRDQSSETFVAELLQMFRELVNPTKLGIP
jgi:hypothetical protein